MRKVHTIVVHHTAGSRYESVASIDRKHRARGFRGIGYHAVVRYDILTKKWVTEPGRSVYRIGAHAGRGRNKGTLGVAVAGNYMIEPIPDNALKELFALLSQWVAMYKIFPDRIVGHCDIRKTLCPGIHLYQFLPLMRELLSHGQKSLQSKQIEKVRSLPLRPIATDRHWYWGTIQKLNKELHV